MRICAVWLLLVSASYSLIAGTGDVHLIKKFDKPTMAGLYKQLYDYDILASINQALQVQCAAKLACDLKELSGKNAISFIPSSVLGSESCKRLADPSGAIRLSLLRRIHDKGFVFCDDSQQWQRLLSAVNELIVEYVQYLIDHECWQRHGFEDFYFSVEYDQFQSILIVRLEVVVFKVASASDGSKAPQMILLGCLGVTVGAFCFNELLEYMLSS